MLCPRCRTNQMAGCIYTCSQCWSAICRTPERDEWDQQEARTYYQNHPEINPDYNGEPLMPRPTATTTVETAAMSGALDTMGKFHLDTDDWSKLSAMCQLALMEAAAILTPDNVRPPGTNMYVIFATDMEGNQQELLVSAPTARRAIDIFTDYNGHPDEWENDPVAYLVPVTAPHGVVQWRSGV